MNRKIQSIPSAKRLITSLRDLGYGFVDAVSEIVDNAIEGGASFVRVDIVFQGENSYLLVMDNGLGMTSQEIQEAMRFGSSRDYSDDDLGRFGLGLKTASLSQCDELIVASRQAKRRAQINSFMWSIDHIKKSNSWEILKVPSADLLPDISAHLGKTVGTVVCWRKLSRLMGYRFPTGKHAEQEANRMVSELRLGLGATFHRFLSGELGRKRLGIFINGEPVEPWDPFCRAHRETDALPSFQVPVSRGGKVGRLVFHPFLLPTAKSFSSPNEFIRAGGLKKWNKQQGFYIYRAGRLLQSGGWSGLRTADEHTKLIRILIDIPPRMDELFNVNVSKMRVSIPRDIKNIVLDQLAPVVKAGQEKYRRTTDSKVTEVTFGVDQTQLQIFASEFGFEAEKLEKFVLAIGHLMNPAERRVFLSGLRRYIRCIQEVSSSDGNAA